MWLFKRNVKIFIWKGGKWVPYKPSKPARPALAGARASALHPQRNSPREVKV